MKKNSNINDKKENVIPLARICNPCQFVRTSKARKENVIADLIRNPLKHVILALFGIILLLTGCIADYNPVGVADTSGILVVDGFIIANGRTTIKLSRTIKLDDQFPKDAVYVQNANIQLIDENDRIIAVAEPQIADGKLVAGTYEINDLISYNPSMKYALDIRIENSHYRSDFISPVHTPEIDEVTWSINTDKSMDIMVSTHDSTNRTKYFFWRFEEDWEFIAPLLAEARYDPVTKSVIPHSHLLPDNKYYCWRRDESKSMLYSSSDRLSESVVKNRKIHQISPNDPRFCYLYSILVKQYGLDKEAYDYFENLQRNIEESGSLFAPQPTEIEGNMRCLSNPDELVIGYIAITKEVTHRLFIDMEKLNLYRPEDSCSTELTPEGEPPGEFVPSRHYPTIEIAFDGGLGIYQVIVPGVRWYCFMLRCVDCTYTGNTKNKPAFWPNDHL